MLIDLISEEANKVGLGKYISGIQVYVRVLEKRDKTETV